jgi:phosphate transport system ATP-binding protein
MSDEPRPVLLEARELTVRAGAKELVRNVSFTVREREVFGILGPSGVGKSTVLRALNRLTELQRGLSVTGQILLRGQSIHAPSVDVNVLRARVGLIFQQPVIFPASVAENVLFGAKRLRSLTRSEAADLTERALRETALWDEVRDRLRASALTLSVGQQQRLCLARALAVEPELLLLDEPTSALDPKSTQAIEDLILRLKAQRTIVLVTHNVAQARRIADSLACICINAGAGELIESGPCERVLNAPRCRGTVEYLAHAG